MERWKYLIYNGTIETLIRSNNVVDNVVSLTRKVFISVGFSIASHKQEMRK